MGVSRLHFPKTLEGQGHHLREGRTEEKSENLRGETSYRKVDTKRAERKILLGR